MASSDAAAVKELGIFPVVHDEHETLSLIGCRDPENPMVVRRVGRLDP